MTELLLMSMLGLYYGNECGRDCGELCLFLCVNKWMVDDACNLHRGDAITNRITLDPVRLMDTMR